MHSEEARESLITFNDLPGSKDFGHCVLLITLMRQNLFALFMPTSKEKLSDNFPPAVLSRYTEFFMTVEDKLAVFMC